MSDLLPGVSVIIPCHNQGNTVLRAVQSALSAGADEIIIVSDGGNDDAWETIKALETDKDAAHPISAIPTYAGIQPAGVSFARNLGISMARHMFVLPLDADDELLPGGLLELRYSHHWPKDQPGGVAVYGNYKVNDVLMPNANPDMIYRKSVCHATVLFSKEDWQRVGGYKPEFNVGCEDWEFMLSLLEAGVKLKHIDTPIYRKAINPNGRGVRCLGRRPLIASLLKEFHPGVQL